MRIETIGDATLYLGDCRDVLPTLGKVDAVVTDPPYCIGFKYASHDDNNKLEYFELIQCLRPFPLALLQYPEEMMKLVVPVLGAPDDCIAWVYPSNLKRQFRLWGLWGLKPNYSAVKQKSKNPKDHRVSEMVDSYDWFEHPQVKNISNEKTSHPCQIPQTSVERIIRLVGGGTICDPFLGSGTTGAACAALGLSFIGIEREPAYFDIACRRIEEAYRQPRLFEATPQAKPVQESLL